MIFFISMIIFSPFTAIIPAVYAGNLLFAKKLKIEKNYWNIGLFLLFCYSVFSALINKSILSLAASVGLFLYFSISILFQNYFVEITRVNRVLRYIVYLTMLMGIAGIVEKLAFMFMRVPNHRIFSSFGNPNMAGAWFGSILLVAIYAKSNTKDKKSLRLYNVSMLIIVIALLLTQSSGAFIALMGSLFLYYVLRRDKSLQSILTLIISVIVIAGIFIFVQSKVVDITPMSELKVSFNSRYDIWIGSTKMFLEKPIIGWGLLGNLEHGIDYNYRNGNSIHSHNLWLTFLVSGGIVFLAIYLYIKYNLFKDIMKLYRAKNKMVPLIVALNCMVIIQGLVDCSLYAPQLGILFIATGSITYNLSNNRINKKCMKNKCKIKRVYKVKNNKIAI